MSVLSVYNSLDLEIDHGDGVYIYSTDGTRYLDFTSGIGVTSLGHSHPALISALKEQADKIRHCSNLFKITGQHLVAKKIVDNSFASNVFFCNSGAEAIESGIKVVRKYFSERKSRKFKIICANNSIHGRTIAAISASGQSKLVNGFHPTLDGFKQVEFNNIDEIKKNVDDETAAILIETIQGEGGVEPASKEYLSDLKKIVKDNDLLLFLDEVQCGIGRTGKFLAFEWMDKLTPNIVSVAKGIGGGFPVGALLLDKKTSAVMTPGTHGSTFGGNPLAMAVSNAVLDYVLKKDFLEHVIEVGGYLNELLQKEIIAKFPKLVKGIRGKGLMLGLEAKEKNEILINAMINEKLLTVKAGQNVVRMLPPLILEKKHVDEAIEKMNNAFLDL